MKIKESNINISSKNIEGYRKIITRENNAYNRVDKTNRLRKDKEI